MQMKKRYKFTAHKLLGMREKLLLGGREKML